MGSNKKKEKLYTGTLSYRAKGFAFVTLDDTNEDIFIKKTHINGAFLDDKVNVCLLKKKHGEKREGRIVDILSHTLSTIVGTYEKSDDFGFVICDNKKIGVDIYIPYGCDINAVTGHKVVVDIVKYANDKNKPEGVITEIIGHKSDPGVEIISMIKALNVPYEFPDKVISQASKANKAVSKADMAGREDYRDVLMVTIDGEDAKDLDDAVSVSYDGTNYILGVYIADVSNYVQANSALDKEAYKRGTSVYLIDRVIPMLPHALSNGICSLNQGEDRLCLCCIMTINNEGDIIDHNICEGVINVNYRMTYSDVASIIDGDSALIDKYRKVYPMFLLMDKLSGLLREKRKNRGGIDFDLSETKFELDKEGNIIDIKPYIRDRASLIIEDFMLACNETVAEDFYWRESAFLYRTHAAPFKDKVRELKAFVAKFGYVLKGDFSNMHPKEFAKMIDDVKGKNEEAIISKMALRTMQQAIYSDENLGHFGLAAQYYCHFTSPIRRYPDLVIHRIIKDHLRGRYDDTKDKYLHKLMPQIAVSTSNTEKRAVTLEREVDKFKKVQYMQGFINHNFYGIISQITSFGMYVELDNGVDGLVHISTLLDDYYYFDRDNLELIGENSKKIYTIGSKVKVRLTNVDLDLRTIDFELI